MDRFLKITLFVASLLAFVPFYAGSTGSNRNDSILFLNREAELRHYMRKFMIDEEWIRVAKLEAGAQLDSRVAKRANNFFGLHKAGKRKSTAVGRYHFYARYASAEDCVRDIRLWCEMSPRKEGESFERFLRRRGWNHHSDYWQRLRGVRIAS